MKITTDRLELYVLTAAQIRLLADNLSALERELDFTYGGEPLRGRFLDIIREQAIKAACDAENYIFHSFWLIIRKSDRVAVGMASFKNVPRDSRETEIGYGLGEAHRGNGYMTETVKAMCNWALAHPSVSCVTAETEPGSDKSERILQRVGFKRYKTVGENCWWRICG